MIKKYSSYILLIILVLFSFFYTEKTVSTVRQKDPIMMDLSKNKDNYKVLNVEGKVVNDTLIPGINGCEVDVDKSYYSLKRLGTFNSNLLVYKTIYNLNSIKNNYDKYIVMGNEKKGNVSLIFKAFKNDNIDNILNILENKKVKATFFLDGKFIENNINLVNKMINIYEVYGYGYDKSFVENDILYTDSLIFRIKYDNNKICLNENSNSSYLDYCKEKKISTIKSSIITGINPIIEIKENIKKGSIISFNISDDVNKELNLIINYIFQKGYNIDYIKDLLNEDNPDCFTKSRVN